MGRPKKNDSGVMVQITVEFYENVAHGDLSKMKFTKISEYAKSRGYDMEEQHFRRDALVKAKIEELREAEEGHRKSRALAAYKNLNVNELLLQSRSLEELKRNISGLDGYWREIYEESNALVQENKRLRDRLTFEKEVRDLEGRNLVLSDALEENGRMIRMMEKEITYLKSMLRKYLYPSLAEVILQEEGLLKAVPSSIRAEAIAELIEEKSPAAFKGKPHGKPEKQTRMDKLLNDLEGMVDRK